MKETGTTHWVSTNTGDNSSGFTALPGGTHEMTGVLGGGGSDDAGFWTSTFFFDTYAKYRRVFAYKAEVYDGGNQGKGKFRIETGKALGNKVDVKVFDVFGKAVSASARLHQEGFTEIDMPASAKGVYLLKIAGGSSRKIIVE